MERQPEPHHRDIGDRSGHAYALNQLGLVQQLTRDYLAAAASHRQALRLYRELGQRYEQSQVLNNLGELSSRSVASRQARDYHNQALTIAREVGAPLEEARALEGIGHSQIRDGNPGEGFAPCTRHWRSTSASQPPMPSASWTCSVTTTSNIT